MSWLFVIGLHVKYAADRAAGGDDHLAVIIRAEDYSNVQCTADAPPREGTCENIINAGMFATPEVEHFFPMTDPRQRMGVLPVYIGDCERPCISPISSCEFENLLIGHFSGL